MLKLRRILLCLPLLTLVALVPSCAALHGEQPPASPNALRANSPFGTATPVYGVAGSLATGAVAGAGTYRSDWVDLSEQVGGISFDVAWAAGSGSPAGTLGLEVSNANAPPPDLNTATNTLTLANTPAAITGNSGLSGVDAPLTGFRWVRVVATVTSGTFTLTALAYAKQIKTGG